MYSVVAVTVTAGLNEVGGNNSWGHKLNVLWNFPLAEGSLRRGLHQFFQVTLHSA